MSCLRGMRGYQKKKIFRIVRDSYHSSGIRDKRLLFGYIRDNHFDGDIPDTHKNNYLFAISKVIKDNK